MVPRQVTRASGAPVTVPPGDRAGSAAGGLHSSADAPGREAWMQAEQSRCCRPCSTSCCARAPAACTAVPGQEWHSALLTVYIRHSNIRFHGTKRHWPCIRWKTRIRCASKISLNPEYLWTERGPEMHTEISQAP